MAKLEKPKPIKRTVAIHPLMDEYVRKTWSLLIEDGHVPDATYSAALNFMLMAAIMEAHTRKGWTRNTRDTAWGFARDKGTIEELKIHEALPLFKDYIEQQEFKGK